MKAIKNTLLLLMLTASLQAFAFGNKTTNNQTANGGKALAGAAAGALATAGVEVEVKTFLKNTVVSNNQLDNKNLGVNLNSLKAGKVNGKTGDNVITTTVEGDETDIPVSTAYSPGLVAAGDIICMGSSSGGLQLFDVGVSGGSTWESEFCKTVAASRHFQAMGNTLAASKRMCFIGGRVDYNNAVALYGSPIIWRVKVPNGFQQITAKVNCWALQAETEQLLAEAKIEGTYQGVTVDGDGDKWLGDKMITE